MNKISIRDINKNALNLIHKFHKFGYESYLVGGCVRDMLMGFKPKDWDLCTNAHPEDIIRVLKSNHINWYAPGLKFGTVIAKFNDEEFEITTYRKETGYSDNRHPDKVEFANTIGEDLSRRDFTINAIALTVSNGELQIVDKFNGIKDINDKTLKTVGNPSKRFTEDSLRILRALRFAVKFDMDIEHNTEQAMENNTILLENISKERITQELEKILTSGKPVRKHLLKYDYILKQILPEIIPCINFKQNNKYHKHTVYEHMLAVTDLCNTDDFVLKLSALLHDIGKPSSYTLGEDGYGHFYGHPEISFDIAAEIFEKRLVLTNGQKNEALNLILNHDYSIRKTSKSIKKALKHIGVEIIDKWFILKQADLDDHINIDVIGDGEGSWRHTSELIQLKNDIIAQEQCFGLRDLKINGQTIMNELGLKPGKQIGLILSTLLEEVIEEKIVNETTTLIDRAKEIVNGC